VRVTRGPTLPKYFIDEITDLNNTTPIRPRGGNGLGFPGVADPFAFERGVVLTSGAFPGPQAGSPFWPRPYAFHSVHVLSAIAPAAFDYRLNKWVDKLHCKHMNPLKRKLADHPKDWPWSSFEFYSNEKNFLIRVDPVN
jgi:hypothetical protein